MTPSQMLDRPVEAGRVLCILNVGDGKRFRIARKSILGG